MMSTIKRFHCTWTLPVPFFIGCVQQDKHDVKATEQRASNGHIDTDGLISVVLPLGIGGGQDGAPRIELADKTGLEESGGGKGMGREGEGRGDEGRERERSGGEGKRKGREGMRRGSRKRMVRI